MGGYYAGVPTFIGPCAGCGREIHKYVRPGKEALCVPCGIEKMTKQQRSAGDPEEDAYRRNRALGDAMAEQFARGEGEWYERWREGMQRYLNASFATTTDEDATLTATKPPGRSRRTRRK